MAELCRRYSVSRKTGYKWLQRYQQQSWEGLQDHSRAPQRHPGQTAAAIEQEILALAGAAQSQGRCGHVLEGAAAPSERRQPDVAWPAVSTIGNLLRRHGLSVPRRRRPRAAPTPLPLTPGKQPNQVWCADFKGWFRTQDGMALRSLNDLGRGQPLPVAVPGGDETGRGPCSAVVRGDVSRVWTAAGDAHVRQEGPAGRLRPWRSSTGWGGWQCGRIKLRQRRSVPTRIEPGHPE